MKLVTIYLTNGSKVKIECERAQELAYIKADGEIRRGSFLTLEVKGNLIARFTLDNIAGYQVSEIIEE